MPLPTVGFPASLTEAVSVDQAQTITGAKTFTSPPEITPAAATSGVRTLLTIAASADTGITASTEQTDIFFDLSATRTWATGALTTQRFMRLMAPTIAFAGASTVTTAVTFDIAGAPIAGTNATITTSYAFRVVAGTSYFGGAVVLAGGALLAGNIQVDSTDASGTPGAATINKPSGTVSIAIGAASVTVTNSLVTASSRVFATLQFGDATLTTILRVVPGSGSFVITGNANATAATKVAFFVIN
jgi:hypothetical protein